MECYLISWSVNIAKYLLKLKLNKASSLDRFVLKLLIETATVLSSPLGIIFNRSLKDGIIVPSEWKKANASAIFEKGSSCSAGHFHPVSLTWHTCNVLESIFRDIIINHFSKYKLSNQSQHGFVLLH